METVSIIKDLILSIAAIVTIFVALYGLNAWRKELKGKTEYEIARRILRSIYKVRVAIDLVRRPFVSAGEMATALKEQGKDPKDALETIGTEGATAAAYERRWKEVSNAVAELHADFFEGQVLWGDKTLDAIKPFLKCVNSLGTYLEIYFTRKRQTDSDLDNKIQDIVFGIDSIEGPFASQYGKELKQAVETAETFLRQHLRT